MTTSQLSSAGGALAPTGSLRRSLQLFRAFRVEQTDPDHFYSLLALDSIREVGRWCDLDGATVLDVGGGPGYFADAFAAAGARYAGVDPDVGELTARGGVGTNMMRASSRGPRGSRRGAATRRHRGTTSAVGGRPTAMPVGSADDPRTTSAARCMRARSAG